MSIRPITSTINFKGKERVTEKGNTYQASNLGRNLGVATGVVAGSVLMYTQLQSLKTVQGKRNLIAGFKERGKSLNDVVEKVLERDKTGKIIPLDPGTASSRSKAIVKGFAANLAVWGAGITAVTTLFGKLIDTNINSNRAKLADHPELAK